MKTAEKDNVVKVHYTGKLEDGQVFDTSKNRAPLEFKVGDGKLIKGFEDAVLGMELNEQKTVNIPKDDAYGDAREDLVYKIGRDRLPDDLEPKVGMDLVSKFPDGTEQVVKIAELSDSEVTIDANHPLAGKDLVFDLELIEIK